MTKENENVPVVNKSSYTQEEINAAYDATEKETYTSMVEEVFKNEGRIEGMLAYQKRLIDNLKRDNVSLNQKLQDIKK